MRPRCAWILALLAAGWAWAPARASAPEGIHRLAASFDFESERPTGQDLPRGWYASAIPGVSLDPAIRFPRYLRASLTDAHAHDGQTSFSMTLNGGNVAYTFTDGVPAAPDSDHLLVGYVRTEGLSAARAQAHLVFVDAKGRPLAGTHRASIPLGERGGPAEGRWQRFEVALRGSHPEAAALWITLSLVQGEVWQPPHQRALDRQDITGACWWDDLAVYRLPRITVGTDVPANVFGPGVRPALITRLEGLDPQEMTAVLTVRDADGQAKAQRILRPPPADVSPDQRLELPDLEPGWYTVDLAVTAAGEVLGYPGCRFAVLAPVPAAGSSGLALDAVDLPADQWPLLLSLAAPLRAGAVKLPAWPAMEGDSQAALAAMLGRLHDCGLDAAIVFDDLPAGPAFQTADTLADAMARGDPLLTEQIGAVMARHASRVACWQMEAGRDARTMWNPRLGAAYATGRRWTERLVNDAGLVLGWDASVACDLPSPRLALRIDPSLRPEDIPDQLAEFEGVHEVHLAPQDPGADRLARLADFALRYAYVRAAGTRQVAIDPPWRLGEDGRAEPTELLVVARTLAAYLGDARCLGTARLDAATVAVVFARPDGEGIMLIDRRPDDRFDGPLSMALSESAYLVDLWGRRSVPRREGGRAIVQPGATPLLLGGCPAPALALRGSLRFEPSILESTYQEHAGRVRFTNPFNQPVSGTIHLEPPEGWTIRPRVARFSAAAGGQWSGEVAIRFPYSAAAGLHTVNVTLRVEAREDHRIEAPAFLHLALPEVTFDPISAIADDGTLHVQVCVVNHSREPLSFNCFAHPDGRARQSSVVQDLPPGAKAVKLFRFDDGAALVGSTLHTGLHQIDGPAVLNHADVVR
ncbi:MAG: hypothetical protein GX591_10695 [Planctomycetes bacterium]|nr:hypothetical protein [Planctomycetota bacterium]